jgi:catechol 2,3-dioxygenase-like lactoylglutathione lyase family enzyme
MSQSASEPRPRVAEKRDFAVTMMYHPSHHVPSLSLAETWFQRVFGRASTRLATMMKDAPPREGYPRDYSTFTPIQDVLFDTIDPKEYVLLGIQRYKTVEKPHLKATGWYFDDMAAAYRAMKAAGIRAVSQLDELAEGDDPPTAAGSPMPLFFTLPEDAGIRYEIFPQIPFPLDPRIAPDWTLSPVSDDDPLGIERCSHHTFLTRNPDRALRFAVDVLGGTIVHAGRDELRGTSGTYVHLADGVLEYAVPDGGTPAADDLADYLPDDAYHAITWKVADLERTRKHLENNGVLIRAESDDTIITDPDTSLGVPWGFTTKLVPGDPRA